MNGGRGSPAPPPPISEEERWLQTTESALFLYRLMTQKLDPDHPAYSEDDWYFNATQNLPGDTQLLRIAEEVAKITDLPPESPTWSRIERLREVQWTRRGWTSTDARLLLEGLVERMYERREEAEL